MITPTTKTVKLHVARGFHIRNILEHIHTLSYVNILEYSTTRVLLLAFYANMTCLNLEVEGRRSSIESDETVFESKFSSTTLTPRRLGYKQPKAAFRPASFCKI